LRDSDDDVAGMVNLQQQDQPAYNDPAARGRESDPLSPTSVYSRGVTSAQYVPPREAWRQDDQPNGPVSPPLREENSSVLPSSNLFGPTHGFPPTSAVSPIEQHPAPRHVRGGSEHYYEDVDPRFASDPQLDAGVPQNQRESGLPSALTPGANAAYRMPPPTSNYPIPTIHAAYRRRRLQREPSCWHALTDRLRHLTLHLHLSARHQPRLETNWRLPSPGPRFNSQRCSTSSRRRYSQRESRLQPPRLTIRSRWPRTRPWWWRTFQRRSRSDGIDARRKVSNGDLS